MISSENETRSVPARGPGLPQRSISKIRERARRNWKTSLSSVGGSEKVRKKVLTVLLYFLMCIIMAAVFVWAEYQNDRQNRIHYKNKLHEYVKEISEFSKVMDVVEWRYYAKSKINELVELNYALNIGSNYRVEAWSFANAFVFCLSTTTTIGYGHPSPYTTAGRIITIILCITGIPFAYMALTDFVDLFLVLEKFLWLMVKKKGNKPISKLQRYGRQMSQHVSRLFHSDKLGKPIGYSAPAVYYSIPDNDVQLPVTMVTSPTPYASTTHSEHSTKSPAPSIKAAPAAGTSKTSPQTSGTRQLADIQDAVVEEKEDGTEETRHEAPRQQKSLASLHSRHGCMTRMFTCFYENCCEDHGFVSDTDIADEEDPSSKSDQTKPDQVDHVPGIDFLNLIKLKTGTVRREVEGEASSRQTTRQVIDGEIISHADSGRKSYGNRRVSNDTMHSLQTALKRDLESASHHKERSFMRLADIKSTHSVLADKSTEKNIHAELLFPQTVVQHESNAGATARYSVNQYTNLDERIEQHRMAQHQLHREEKRRRSAQPPGMRHRAESRNYPQPPPNLSPSLAFMIEAGHGMIPAHDHALCNDLFLSTMQSLIQGVAQKVKEELDERADGHTPTAGPSQVNSMTSSNAIIADIMSTTTKEAQKYKDQHKDIAGNTLSTPRESTHSENSSVFSTLNVPPVLLEEAESDMSTANPDLDPDLDIDLDNDPDVRTKKRPKTATDVNIEIDQNNCCAALLEHDGDNVNENAKPSPIPTITRSRMSTPGSNRSGPGSMDRLSRITIATLMHEELQDDDADREELSLAITFLNLVLYIFVGAMMFVYEEGWDYLTAVYYIFTSISTIGFGDIMPTGGTALFFWSSLYILAGLAFLAKVIQGIRSAMLRFMMATVNTVEKAGVKIVSNISHLSQKTSRRRVAVDNISADASEMDIRGEVQLKSHTMHEGTPKYLVVPSQARARSMMKVQSLPSAVIAKRGSASSFGNPSAQEQTAFLTPAQAGKRNKDAAAAEDFMNVHKTDSLNIVCSDSLINVNDREELEKSELRMTPMSPLAADSDVSLPVSILRDSPQLPLSPPPCDPTLKQRRLSLLTNDSLLSTEDILEESDDINTAAQLTEKQKPKSQATSHRPNSQATSHRPNSQATSHRPNSQATSHRPNSQATSHRPKSQASTGNQRPGSRTPGPRPKSQAK